MSSFGGDPRSSSRLTRIELNKPLNTETRQTTTIANNPDDDKYSKEEKPETVSG